MFQRVFDHSPDGKEVSDRILSFEQGSRRAAEYSLEFCTLAAESGWNDSVLRAVYLKGLNKELIKELACQEEVNSLDKLISMSMKLDNILKENVARNFITLHYDSSCIISHSTLPINLQTSWLHHKKFTNGTISYLALSSGGQPNVTPTALIYHTSMSTQPPLKVPR